MPSSCQNTKRWRAALPSSPKGSKSWFTDRILWFFSWEILGRAIVIFYCMTLIFCCHRILLLDWWPAVSFDTGLLPGHSSAFCLHIIWLINLAAGFRRVSKYDLYLLSPLWDQFWMVPLELRVFPSFHDSILYISRRNYLLVLENPSWITWSCHFGNVANFLSSHCLWKFYDSPLPENWGKCICMQDQSSLWDVRHLPPCLHLIRFGRLRASITLSGASVPAHTNLHCILRFFFTKILLFGTVKFVTIFVMTFYFNTPLLKPGFIITSLS